jgi:ribonucleoside-diphosphate reductase alpha chain
MEYTSPDEVAVCNLASPYYLCLWRTVSLIIKRSTTTKRVTRNLNKVIDRNYYPVKEAENSNLRHRLVRSTTADAFIMLRLPFR